MPQLACVRCGRRLDDLAPTDAHGGEARRCPRCGAVLGPERPVTEGPEGGTGRSPGAAGMPAGERSAEGRPAGG